MKCFLHASRFNIQAGSMFNELKVACVKKIVFSCCYSDMASMLTIGVGRNFSRGTRRFFLNFSRGGKVVKFDFPLQN